ncbi:MAG: DUF2431 domain-containing protein [Alphaproteobacteria bacterium]|nr:DUF2431 domain-containing protein [Alphaproteobacteria bacterium]
MDNISLHHSHFHMSIICSLGIINQSAISHCLDYGFINEAKKLYQLKHRLIRLLQYKTLAFDFVTQLATGMILLVGEGNLSFSLSLLDMECMNPLYLTATTYEQEKDLSLETIKNAQKLKRAGVLVQHNVDATNLTDKFNKIKFDAIVFQFPNVASREAIEGHNPNFILVRDFLKSAANHLTSNGKVFMSAVDNPYYHGAFQFDKAAKFAGFPLPDCYPFDPTAFSGYNHMMTHQDENGIENHDIFATWVFSKK